MKKGDVKDVTYRGYGGGDEIGGPWDARGGL